MRPGFQGPVTSPTISISTLLDFVNQYFPDILPEDVLKHYGVSMGISMVISLSLRSEPERMQMIEFLLSREKVTDEEALNEARRISGE